MDGFQKTEKSPHGPFPPTAPVLREAERIWNRANRRRPFVHEKWNDLVPFGVDDLNSGPASSDSWLFRFLVRFADVFSPIAKPFGDLPTKCEALSILSSSCRLFQLLINLFGHLVIFLASLNPKSGSD